MAVSHARWDSNFALFIVALIAFVNELWRRHFVSPDTGWAAPMASSQGTLDSGLELEVWDEAGSLKSARSPTTERGQTRHHHVLFEALQIDQT